MVEYCKGSNNDMPDITDFGNYVFSQRHAPTDFKKLLPKVYADKYNTAGQHHILKENGKIKAMILEYPGELKVGHSLLKVSHIGTVSVHPYSQGRGYMQDLMNHALQEMREDGCQMSILGGQRQRYEYFGYEPCGLQIDFTVTATNIKHKYRELDSSKIVFKEIVCEDEALIANAYGLYQSNMLTGVRTENEFYDIALSWGCRLFAVYFKEDFTGYIICNNITIEELVLADNTNLPAVIKAWLETRKFEQIHIALPMHEQQKLKYFADMCESFRLTTNKNYNIFDYKAVIKAFMELKASYVRMPDGKSTIKIGDETILIRVAGEKIEVYGFEGEADMCFSPLEAMQYVFSPAGDFLRGENKIPEPAKSWFPLPLFIPSADCC